MGDPALAKSNNPLSIEGLEDVFDTSELASDTSEAAQESHIASSEPYDPEVEATSEVFGTAREILTTTEAATRLGISTRAVINRLRAGTLAGQRTKGKFKEEWRVYWNDLPNCSEQPVINQPPASEPSEAAADPTTEQFRTASEPGFGEHILTELLSAHTEQIKAQNELIRYLTEQLKNKDQQIHLLTDSQHKRGWSQKFASWFFGQPNSR
jgi:hypothetical protein